jgi:DnaJ-class molecular chaperone
MDESPRGERMKGAILVLPTPISARTLERGGIESFVLGGKEIKFRVPPGGRMGGRIRLPKVAHLVDPAMVDGDVHLLVVPGGSIYQVKRDVELEMRLPPEKMHRGAVERINIGERRIDVKIPAGRSHGQRIRLGDLGHLCNGGYPGDIFLRLSTLERQRARWWAIFSTFGHVSQRIIGVEFNLLVLKFYHEWVIESRNVGLGVSS